MTRITASKAKESFTETLRRVSQKRLRLVVSSQGKDIAAIVPIEDLTRLQELEDRLDAQLAKKALADSRKKRETPISWTEAKKHLGL